MVVNRANARRTPTRRGDFGSLLAQQCRSDEPIMLVVVGPTRRCPYRCHTVMKSAMPVLSWPFRSQGCGDEPDRVHARALGGGRGHAVLGWRASGLQGAMERGRAYAGRLPRETCPVRRPAHQPRPPRRPSRPDRLTDASLAGKSPSFAGVMLQRKGYGARYADRPARQTKPPQPRTTVPPCRPEAEPCRGGLMVAAAQARVLRDESSAQVDRFVLERMQLSLGRRAGNE